MHVHDLCVCMCACMHASIRVGQSVAFQSQFAPLGVRSGDQAQFDRLVSSHSTHRGLKRSLDPLGWSYRQCYASYRCWKLNQGPHQEQKVLLLLSHPSSPKSLS